MKYLLLLHGYTQNAERFTKQVSKLLSKSLTKEYKILSIDGPYQIEKDQYGWWPLSSPEMYSQPHHYENYEVALEKVRQAIPALGPDDQLDIIAFSQGAVLAEVLLPELSYRRVILFSPSGIMDERLKNISVHDCQGKVIVSIGEREGIYGISHWHYAAQSSLDNYIVGNHDQGHVVPSGLRNIEVLRQFLR